MHSPPQIVFMINAFTDHLNLNKILILLKKALKTMLKLNEMFIE